MDLGGLWLFPAIGALFVVVGTSFATSGVRRARRWRRFVDSARLAEADVIDLRVQHSRSSDGDTSTYWLPVVRFALPDGRIVESQTLYGSAPAPARTGDRVQVRYDPEQPTRVNLVGGLAQGSSLSCLHVGLGIFVALFGAVFLLGSVGVWWVTR